MSNKTPPPRLYVITATEAPRAIVFRRGPSDFWNLYLWHTDTGMLEPGAVTNDQIYPRRSDLSPDGQYLSYFDGQYGMSSDYGITEWTRDGPWPKVFVAVSRAPWMYALAMFREIGTWGAGRHFTPYSNPESPAGYSMLGNPDGVNFAEPDAPHTTYKLMLRDNLLFDIEQTRGWHVVEPPTWLDLPTGAPKDEWDRIKVLSKEFGSSRLWQHRDPARKPEGAIELERMHFELELEDGSVRSLTDAYWADWRDDGKLLVATNDARLMIREINGTIIHEASVAEPLSFREAPEWAKRWE